jgi:hypothetical protein
MKKGLKWTLISVSAFVLLIIFGGMIFYFTQINNAFISKPDIPKPEVDIAYLLANPGTQIIFEEHIVYLSNEFGSYKIHESSGGDAVIVFYMVDIDTEVALIQNYADSEVVDEIPDEYDLRISGEQIVIANLIESDNLGDDMKDSIDAGEIEIEIISDMGTLALKGYLGVYDELF